MSRDDHRSVSHSLTLISNTQYVNVKITIASKNTPMTTGYIQRGIKNKTDLTPVLQLIGTNVLSEHTRRFVSSQLEGDASASHSVIYFSACPPFWPEVAA